LEKTGLLRREPDPEDGRGSFPVMTNEGVRMCEKMCPVYAEGIAKYFGAHISDEEAAVLARVLTRVRVAAGPSWRARYQCTLILGQSFLHRGGSMLAHAGHPLAVGPVVAEMLTYSRRT
jgi:hypothetical protein